MNMTIDMNELQMNRKGKAGGHVAEVRRGVGVHVPKKHKKKHKDSWKKDVKKYC